MCYHSKLTKKSDALEKKFKAKFSEPNLHQPSTHINAFDFPLTPICTNQDVSVIKMASWGLIPDWANVDWNRRFSLNAKLETLEQKSAFKNCLGNRCIILSNGFYEWQHSGKKKIKYEIGFGDELFAFAGLFSWFKNQLTYTLITTEAQGIMREIHNTKFRMPFVLKSEPDWERWLAGEQVQAEANFETKRLDSVQGSLF